MQFELWARVFKNFSDDFNLALGVSPEKLNEWKTFIRDYRLEKDRYVTIDEYVTVWYLRNPDERPVSSLTVAEFKALFNR